MRRHRTARRGMAAAALALTLGLSLTACSGGSGDDPSPSASSSSDAQSAATATDKAAVSEIDVEWGDGQPTVTLPSKPFSVTTTPLEVREPGTGAELTDGQAITIDYVAVSGEDGSELHETYTAEPEPASLGEASLLGSLIGEKVGVRFVVALPPQQEGAPTTVIAGEIVDAKDVPTRASGEAVPPVAGLPTVTLADDGKPSLTPATGTAPTTLVVQPLIKGAGPEVTAGQTVTVHYSGWLWDGTPFDSSWDRGQPYPVENVGQANVIAGWNEGLVGQTVGSQVMLVVPPDKGYGAEDKGTIPPNSTLVFVVDILAAQ